MTKIKWSGNLAIAAKWNIGSQGLAHDHLEFTAPLCKMSAKDAMRFLAKEHS